MSRRAATTRQGSLFGRAGGHLALLPESLPWAVWMVDAWVCLRLEAEPVILGELAFATLCLIRAWTGGFTSGNTERTAYSMMGWLLIGNNVGLCWGLLTSPQARAVYANNGSFGLRNDYIRLAEDVMGSSLPSVALMMLIVAFLSPAIAFAWSYLRGEG